MKILIAHASAGLGHQMAAEALAQALEERPEPVALELLDCLENAPKLYRRIYADGYLAMANHTPELYGYLYKRTDHLRKDKPRLFRLVDPLVFRSLLRRLRREPPDRILATHFLLPDILSRLRRSNVLEVPMDVVITDFDVHTYWVNPRVRKYFVASEEVAWVLRHKGVPPERIEVTGIPVRPVFESLPDRETAARRFGLDPNLLTVLVMAGGTGIGRLDQTVEVLLRLGGSLQVVAVAGQNQEMLRRLVDLKAPAETRYHALGYVEDLPSLMASANLMVTKPGGLTSSECLAAGLPLIVISPIPGQEERNSDYLVEAGAAVKATSLPILEHKIRALIDQPERLSKMKRSALEHARPDAARRIAAAVVENGAGSSVPPAAPATNESKSSR